MASFVRVSHGSDAEEEVLSSDESTGSSEDSSVSDVSVKEENDEKPENSNDTNSNWAAIMARILRGGGNESAAPILSKSNKSDSQKMQPNQKKRQFEVVGEDGTTCLAGEEVEDVPAKKPKKKLKQKEWDSVGRTKPNILEREKERTLNKIATKGVVQLFNAVKSQQKELKSQLDEAGASQRRTDGAYKTHGMEKFKERLKVAAKQAEVKKATKEPKWKVMRDDFMMQHKDWDREGYESDD